ncbi:MAG: Fis family transcriptional regulator [Deltaproteobacteria bacterium]|nr:MAG: Fis family transcriptional regulator [Deltaproteobacteria bacterium]
MAKRIIIIDDEAVVRKSLCRILSGTEYEVETFTSGNQALAELQKSSYDLAITDLKMPGMNGIEVLKAIRILQPGLPVIMVTGYATVNSAVEAMKSGAFEHIEKPFEPDQILETVKKALEWRAATLGKSCPEGSISSLDDLIGDSGVMHEVYRRITLVAPTDSTVLIVGESGTGKELVAHAIHKHSERASRPFVAVDCTALAENLLESELFGHVKGSFTGAVSTKIGLFKVADGGTLFLDEVSNLSHAVQAKLLRVLQEREILPIGGTKSIPTNIRLIAATNENLEDMVAEGHFREDLYFRLNIIPVKLPPLRERGTDRALLARHFLTKYADRNAKDIGSFTPAAISHLENHDFPGNVRELENIIERAVVLNSTGTIDVCDLELNVHSEFCAPKTADDLKFLKKEMREQAVLPVEKSFLISALTRNGWNITRAAEETGMLRQNFQAMMRKHNIQVSEQA